MHANSLQRIELTHLWQQRKQEWTVNLDPDLQLCHQPNFCLSQLKNFGAQETIECEEGSRVAKECCDQRPTIRQDHCFNWLGWFTLGPKEAKAECLHQIDGLCERNCDDSWKLRIATLASLVLHPELSDALAVHCQPQLKSQASPGRQT